MTKEKSYINSEDGDQNFINKQEQEEQNQNIEERLETVEHSAEVKGIIDKLKGFIFPKRNNQRNLDRETGGLEMKERESELKDDIWDERSEEVDAMGSTNTLNSSNMKSVIGKKALRKKEVKKENIEVAMEAAAAAQISKNSKNNFTTKIENSKNNNSGFSR